MPIQTINREIAERFDRIADLLELDQVNPYRVQAYRRAAGIIRTYRRNLAEMVTKNEDLTVIPGVGPDTAAKIREIVLTGSSHFLDKIQQRVPTGLQKLQRIPGLGPRRIRQLYDKLGVKTITQLKQAAQNRRVRRLEGFGPAIERKLLEAINEPFHPTAA